MVLRADHPVMACRLWRLAAGGWPGCFWPDNTAAHVPVSQPNAFSILPRIALRAGISAWLISRDTVGRATRALRASGGASVAVNLDVARGNIALAGEIATAWSALAGR